jgi:hypothetical protein
MLGVLSWTISRGIVVEELEGVLIPRSRWAHLVRSSPFLAETRHAQPYERFYGW